MHRFMKIKLSWEIYWKIEWTGFYLMCRVQVRVSCEETRTWNGSSQSINYKNC